MSSKVIIILIVLFVFYRMIKRYFATGVEIDKSKTVQGEDTVKCDNCSAYVSEDLSVEVRKGSKKLHFCGEECRNDYKSG